MTQLCIFFLWDIVGWTKLNPFYNLVNLPFPFNFIGYTLGVGTQKNLQKRYLFIFLLPEQKAINTTNISVLWFNGWYCIWCI